MGDLRIESSVGAVPGQPTSQALQAVDILAAAVKADPDAAIAAAITQLFGKVDDMDITSEKLAAQLQELTKFTDIANQLKNILSNLESYDKPTEVFLKGLADLKKGIDDSSLPAKVKEGISKNIEKISDEIIKVITKIQNEYKGMDALRVIWDLAKGVQPQFSPNDFKYAWVPTYNGNTIKAVEIRCPNEEMFKEWQKNARDPFFGTLPPVSYDKVNGKIVIDLSGQARNIQQQWAYGKKDIEAFLGASESKEIGVPAQGALTKAIIAYNQNHQGPIDADNTSINTLFSDLNIASTAVSDVSAQTQVNAKQALTNQQMLFGFTAKMIDMVFKIVERISSKIKS